MVLIMTRSPTVLVPCSMPAMPHHHDGSETDCEDGRLTCIEHGERHIGLDARLLITGHGAVIASRLALLGVEIFDRLVIEQASRSP